MKYKKKYRIVKDRYCGFEVQRRFMFFLWFQIRNKYGLPTNTNISIERAEKLIEFDIKRRKKLING